MSFTGTNASYVVTNSSVTQECALLPSQIVAFLTGNKKSGKEHVTAAVACQAVARDLLRELQVWKDSRFADWTQLTMDKLGDIKVDKSGKLMDMNSEDGRIELHYNDELVVLLREVRHFGCKSN